MNVFNWLFGPNSAFGKLFGNKPAPAPVPTPVPVPAPTPNINDPAQSRPVGFIISGPQGPIMGATAMLDFGANGQTITVTTNADGYACVNVFRSEPAAATLNVTADKFKLYSVPVTLPNSAIDLCVIPDGAQIGSNQIRLPALEPLVIARKGLVRKDGRRWVDDTGEFYPLGATLFWILRGWKVGGSERDRVKQNLAYLQKNKVDYVRILCEVGWAGNDIRPDWPDYQQCLGELLDYIYDVCGMRTELTVIGGGTGIEPLTTAGLVAPVALSRPEKILDIEMANEAFQNLPDFNKLVAMAKVFKAAGVQNLLALSSAEGGLLTWDDVLAGKMVPAGVADIMTIHMDRSFGDDGWRAVRQVWDCKDMPYPVSHNEPEGPRSSVAECTDPVQLAMLRAGGIICGAGAFVIHNGSGVGGQVDPTHNRPANLWEVPGIDTIMQVIRNVDAALPNAAGSGQHWNTGWAGCPFVADAFWGDGADHGVNRAYVASTSTGFLCPIMGIKDHANFVAPRACKVDLWDVIENKVVQTLTIPAGGTVTITPHSRDHAGYGAFIAIGNYV